MGNQPVLTNRMPKQEISGTQRMPGVPEKKQVSETDYTGGSLAKGEAITGYAVESKFCSNTGESEIYIVVKDGKQFILKYYYPNFQPKYEILEKLKNLHHDDIVDVLEYGTHKDRFYEIMEYALGGTLADKTEQGAYKYLPMPEERVEQVVREVVNAFKYCHEKGIIHRDIKPSNLFFKNENGTDVIIGDFGISSALDIEGKMSKRMTTTSRTEGYAAPEIYSGVLGSEVDYYALGITVFELLTGKNPFDGRNNMHIMRDTIEGRVIEDLITRPEAKDFSLKIKKLLQGLLTVRHEKRWGYVEVLRWLKGEDVPVFQSIVSSIPALQFGTKNITSLQELAVAIVQDKETGKKMLYRGMLERWAEAFDKHLALKIGDVKESCSDESYQVFGVHQLVFLLDPARPCSSEYKITSVNDLMEYLKCDAAGIGKMLRFERSVLHAWLIHHGMKELSDLCLETSKTTKSDKRLANIILLFLQGDSFRPFGDGTVEFMKYDQIAQLPQEYHDIVLQEFGDYDSMLSIWIQDQLPKRKLDLWEAWKTGGFEKDWVNLCDLLQGKVSKEDGTWKTATQKEKEAKAFRDRQEQERLEREAKEREEERKSQEEARDKAEKARLLKEAKEAYKKNIVDPLATILKQTTLVYVALGIISAVALMYGIYSGKDNNGHFHYMDSYHNWVLLCLATIVIIVVAGLFTWSLNRYYTARNKMRYCRVPGDLSKRKIDLSKRKNAGKCYWAATLIYGGIVCSGYIAPGQSTFVVTNQTPAGMPAERLYYTAHMQVAKEEIAYDSNGNVIRKVAGKLPDGVARSYDTSGRLREKLSVKNGEYHGAWIGYDEIGKIMWEKNYMAGKLNGVSRTYHDNGAVASEEWFKNGMPEGVFKTYDESGKAQTEKSFGGGHLDGVAKKYYVNGNVASETTYNEDKIENVREYYENGKLQSEVNYRDGALAGSQRTYYDIGGLESESFCKVGKIDGLRKEYYPNGRLRAEETFAMGVREGVLTRYTEDEKRIEEALYAKDELVSLKRYYSDGKLASELYYKDGKIDGVAKDYYPDGAIKSETVFKCGFAVGTAKSYGSGGRLSWERTFTKEEEVAKEAFDQYKAGRDLYESGSHYDSIAPYVQAVTLAPRFADAWFELGNACVECGRKEEAVKYYKTVIELKPEFTPAHYKLGNTYRSMGNNSDAIASYKQAIKLKQDYADAYNNLGLVYIDMNRFKDAATILNQGLRSKPKDPDLHFNLGVAYLSVGDHELACNEAVALQGLNRNYAKELSVKIDRDLAGRKERAQKRIQEERKAKEEEARRKNREMMKNVGGFLSALGDAAAKSNSSSSYSRNTPNAFQLLGTMMSGSEQSSNGPKATKSDWGPNMRVYQCPKCAQHVDCTNFSDGSTVRCPVCGCQFQI